MHEAYSPYAIKNQRGAILGKIAYNRTFPCMKIFQHSEALDQWERSNVNARPMRMLDLSPGTALCGCTRWMRTDLYTDLMGCLSWILIINSVVTSVFATCKNNCPGGHTKFIIRYKILIILISVNFPIVTGEAVWQLHIFPTIHSKYFQKMFICVIRILYERE